MSAHGDVRKRVCSSMPTAIVLLGTFALVAGLPVDAGAVLAGIGRVLDLIPMQLQPGAGFEDQAGSGLSVRSEVITLWIPSTLRDFARVESGPDLEGSPEALIADLKRVGLVDAWYALTYRHTRVDGGVAEMTLLRRISGVSTALDDLQDILIAIAGLPPRPGSTDFSHVAIKIIPELHEASESHESLFKFMTRPAG